MISINELLKDKRKNEVFLCPPICWQFLWKTQSCNLLGYFYKRKISIKLKIMTSITYLTWLTSDLLVSVCGLEWWGLGLGLLWPTQNAAAWWIFTALYRLHKVSHEAFGKFTQYGWNLILSCLYQTSIMYFIRIRKHYFQDLIILIQCKLCNDKADPKTQNGGILPPKLKIIFALLCMISVISIYQISQ